MSGLLCQGVGLKRRGPDGGERWVLEDVDVELPAGEVSLVTGATGAGKTTLLHLLAALERPTCGEVRAAGEPVSRWLAAHRDRWRRDVGIVFQRPLLWLDLSALENVMAPLIPRGLSIEQARRQAREALRRAQADSLARSRAAELSMGEKQRVSLARALVAEPSYLLADEPTAHQDDDGCQRIMGQLLAAAERGATVVVASHDTRLLRGSGPTSGRWHLDRGRLIASDQLGDVDGSARDEGEG